ncbi:hypothetical protein JCM10450v2_003479 [Rhodotorula kratochvilovae]
MAHRPAHRHPGLSMARLSRRACSSSSALWTFPAASSDTPVYEDITLEWDPSCVTVAAATVDLYLSVEETAGWLLVHQWEDVPYKDGALQTQFKPSWWNASTGAGSVSAQFSLVPSGQPSWNTPAPTGPVFTISYNGSYPSVTQTADQSTYTGPSVESVSDAKSRSSAPSGGKLAAAVLIPILVVALAAIGYVVWYKRKKRPEKKRFSAVVDHRMSMISQGTWQPRPSMASARPGSMHPSHHRPSASHHSGANRGSYFADPNQRQSTYSFAGSALGGSSPLRPPPPAEMRQTGQGERGSRVSFAGDMHMPRPSFASNTRSSLHQSQLRHSAFLPDEGEPLPSSTSPQHSPQLSRSAGPTFGGTGSGTGVLARSGSSSLSLAVTAPEGEYFSRSSTREELASVHSPSSQSLSGFSRPYGHAQKPSVASSLRHELQGMPALAVVRDGRLAFTSPSEERLPLPPSPQSFTPSSPSSLRPKPSLASLSTESLPGMPRAFDPARASTQILSPDEALASYAREVTSPTPSASQQRGAAKGGFLWAAPRRLLRSFTGGSIAGVLSGRGGAREKDEHHEEKRDGARSPFEDPVEDGDGSSAEDEKRVHGGLGIEHDEPTLRAGEEMGSADSSESLVDRRGPGTAM